LGPIEVGLKYRKITIMIFILLIAAGVLGFLAMPKYEDPQFRVFNARVLTLYPGAAPDQVEALVTKPLEEKISELKDIKNIHSTSYNGVSSIVIDLLDHADQNKSWDDLRRKVNEARALLPPGAEAPEVEDDLNKTSTMIIHLTAPPGKPASVLREIADQWEDSIRQMQAVGKVEVAGLPKEQVQVILDSSALASRQLSWAHLSDALQKRNISVPGGTLREGKMGLMVESAGEYRSLEEIGDTVIFQRPNGVAVRVKDVAGVKTAPGPTEDIIETNGIPGVALTIFPKEGRNISEVEKSISARISNLQKDLPPGVGVFTVFSQAENIEKKFGQLWLELLIGMAMVLLVCILGLHWRTAVMVALAIPTSAAVGFGPLSWMDVSLNQVTISSLIIALGILVDDAIVVNDNIERHLAMGSDRYTAALKGTREVTVSILTATVATVSAFAPLMLLKGNIGEFVRSLPVVVSVTMLASMVVSLWLIPALRYWAAGKAHPLDSNRLSGMRTGLAGPALDRLSSGYEAGLSRTLKRPLFTLIMALCFSGGAMALLPFTGIQFFPYAERSQFVIDITTPKGFSLFQTAGVAGSAAEIVRGKQGVRDVIVYSGRQIPKFYYNEISGSRGETLAQLLVVTSTEKEQAVKELIRDLRENLPRSFPGTKLVVRQLEQGPFVGSPIAVRLCGDDVDKLRALADKVSDILKNTPGAINIHDNMGTDTYTVKINPHPDLTARWGVSEKDIAYSVRMAVDGLKITDYRKGNNIYPVVLRTNSADGTAISHLSSIWVPSWKTGSIIPLTQVASVEAGWTSGYLHRRNLERVITVMGYTDGTLPDDIIRSASGLFDSIPLPPGYRIEYGGENEERKNAFASLGRLSILVGMLVYLIIAIQFYSLTKPAIILLSVFLAISGSILGLFITGTPLGFMALLGMVSLSGIVVRNGIVLVDFIEVSLKEGLPLHDSVLRAGRIRLRPILLTSATAVFGLMPMAVTGSSLFKPIAISIISGLIFSTVLTLIVVPNAYVILTGLLKRSEK